MIDINYLRNFVDNLSEVMSRPFIKPDFSKTTRAQESDVQSLRIRADSGSYVNGRPEATE